MNIIIKRFIAFALSFTLVIVPSLAVYDPNPKHSKWFHDSIVNDPTVKSTVEVKAQKTYPVSTLDQNGKPIKQIRKANATVKVAANVNKVGKTIFKRSPATAITMAMTNLLGRAVDWVLDPENNRIKYKDFGGGTDPQCPTVEGGKSISSVSNLERCGSSDKTFAIQGVEFNSFHNAYYLKKACFSESGSQTTTVRYKCDKADDAPLPTDWQYEDIDTVASQMISDANDGQAPAMQVMKDTALDALEAGDLDSALDAASDIPQPDPEQITQDQYDNPNYPAPDTPTDPDGNTGGETPNPDPDPDPTPTEWPAFCDWAFPVCDFIEWVKAEPEQTDTEIDLQEPDEQPTDTNFDFGGSCPAPIVFEGSIFGQSIEFTMLDTVMLCDFLSTYVKWPVYAASSLFAIYIVGGRKEDG